MKFTIRTPLLALSLSSLLAACSSSEERSSARMEAYLDADYYTRLELPPDLTEPSFSKEAILPEPTVDAKQRHQQQTRDIMAAAEADRQSAATTTAAVVLAGAALQRDGDTRWLAVDADAQTTWSALQQFLLHEGLLVSRQEPQLGLIETDWVAKYRDPDDEGFFSKLFNRFEPDLTDRFVFQIEQAQSGSGNRVFVTHTARERMVDEADVNWVTVGRDSALENEMLQRFALFTGAAASADSYRVFAMRAWPSDKAANSLLVIGDVPHVAGRLNTALQQIGFDDVERRSDNEFVLVLDRSVVLTEVEEEDEIAQSSFIMQWLKGTDSEGEALHLKLSAEGQLTRIDFDDEAALTSDTALTEQLSQSLLDRLI